MLFSKSALALWACATLVAATPVSHNALAARNPHPNQGIYWTPRNVQKRGGRGRGADIIIVQPIAVQPDPVQIGRDSQLADLIGGLIELDGLEGAKDNIRRNHYRNRNRRDDVNTIIIIVVVVVDERDRNRPNRRYLTRQVEVNPGAPNQEWIVVTDQNTMTIGNQNPTAGVLPTTTTAAAALPTTTAAAAPVVPTGAIAARQVVAIFDPNAPLQAGAGEALLPFGVEPRYEDRGASRDNDPAIIIVANQVVFVVFDGDDDNRRKDDDRDGRGRGDDKGH